MSPDTPERGVLSADPADRLAHFLAGRLDALPRARVPATDVRTLAAALTTDEALTALGLYVEEIAQLRLRWRTQQLHARQRRDRELARRRAAEIAAATDAIDDRYRARLRALCPTPTPTPPTPGDRPMTASGADADFGPARTTAERARELVLSSRRVRDGRGEYDADLDEDDVAEVLVTAAALRELGLTEQEAAAVVARNTARDAEIERLRSLRREEIAAVTAEIRARYAAEHGLTD